MKSNSGNIRGINKFTIFFACLVLYFIIFKFTGFIPINSGAGWDGSIYLDYIEKFSSGENITGDPYRLLRLSGFVPAIIASKLGLENNQIIFFQAVLNAAMLSFGASIFYITIKSITNNAPKALISTFILVFSWPFIVMPVFYPVLSDHLALFIAIASIYAWRNSYLLLQCLLIYVSVWIMPGLFLLPVMLASLNFKSNNTDGHLKSNTKLLITIFLVFLLLISGVWLSFSSLPGNYDLKIWSGLFMVFALSFVAYIFSKLISSPEFRSTFNLSNFFIAVMVAAIGVFSVYYFIDWSDGFRGPPLHTYLLQQTAAAPGKPLVSHFLYFGPVIFIAIFAIGRFGDYFWRSPSFPLSVVFVAFMPLLILGSESRQWIFLLPLAVAIVDLKEKRVNLLLYVLIFSIIFCTPALFLNEKIGSAINTGANFWSNEWQYYFGRQGPWMSNRTYMIGLLLINIFISFYFIIKYDGAKSLTSHSLEKL